MKELFKEISMSLKERIGAIHCAVKGKHKIDLYTKQCRRCPYHWNQK